MERRGVVDVAIVQVLPVSISNKGGMINWQLAALAKGNITTLATFNRSIAPHAAEATQMRPCTVGTVLPTYWQALHVHSGAKKEAKYIAREKWVNPRRA